MSLAALRTAHWSRELWRCERDPEYLARTYLRIKAKDEIRAVNPTIIPRPAQRMALDAMRKQWEETGYVRMIFGKARQLGLTTICRALAFHQTAFQDNLNTLFLNYDEDNSLNIFTELDKGFLEGLPAPLKPTADSNARQRIVFKRRKSRALAGHALNPHVGASQMNHMVHLTEAARYRNGAEIQSSLFPSISGARDKTQGFGRGHSIIVIESTSHIYGDWYKKFAEATRKGENGDWRFLFFPWFQHPAYRAEVPRDYQPDAEEWDLIRRFKLEPAQVMWRRQKRAEYAAAGKLAFFSQEYPVDFDESWALPEGAMYVFSPEQIRGLRAKMRPGKRCEPESDGLKPTLGGRVEVWVLPEDGVYYDMGVDVAGGATHDADWTVLCVLRRDTLEQVAECRIHQDPASAEFVDLVYWLGRAYNTAQINPDITAGWAAYLMNELQSRSYPNIWRWRNRDDARERVSQRLGFMFTRRDKRHLVTNAIALVTRGAVTVHSSTLLDEMDTFLCLGLDEWGATSGHHDDTVVAWMLALLAARDEGGGVIRMPDTPEPEKPEPWLTHDIDADLEPVGAAKEFDPRPWK